MDDKINKINETDKLDGAMKYYWGYQYRLGKEIIVPFLIDKGAFRPGDKVVEIGCAEGGVLTAFVEAGAGESFGTDIEKTRLKSAASIAEILRMKIDYFDHNIVTEEPPEDKFETVDLAVLRDVIEHLDDTTTALKNIGKVLRPGGLLYVTFPPYCSAYGGHQHTIHNFIGKFPFVHLLPGMLFKMILKGGRPGDAEEVRRLSHIRLTPKKFVSAARSAGYEIVREDYFALRPVYKFKFGLPSLSLNALKFLPGAKSILSMEASYILKKL